MKRERAKELAPIIQAYGEGKDIQAYEDGRWYDLLEASWGVDCPYRIKPSEERGPEVGEPWHITSPDHNGEYGVWQGHTKCIAEGLTLAQAQKLVNEKSADVEARVKEAGK